MDRTKEFQQIILLTCGPQPKLSPSSYPDSYSEILNRINNLEYQLNNTFEISKKLNYQKLIDQLEKEITEVKLSNIKYYKSLQDENVHTRILEMTGYSKKKCMIALNRCIDAFSNAIQSKNKIKIKTNNTYSEPDTQSNQAVIQELEQQTVLLEKQQIRQRSDFDLRKERIQTQINELGQIVCDISLHIQSQGENLKRIDDLVDDTGTFLKKNMYEIKRIEKMVKENRGTIVFFFFIALIMLFLRFLLK